MYRFVPYSNKKTGSKPIM